MRPHSVAYLLSGEEGAVCYEEVSGHGRLAVLTGRLEERMVDERLARKINPKAFWKNGLIIHHQGTFAYLDFDTSDRRKLADFVPTRTIGPFARVDEGYEFIAVQRGPHWPTFLHRMVLPDDGPIGGKLVTVAKAEDPIFPRLFLPLPGGDYLVAPQGEAMLEVYKVFTGGTPGLRTWSLTSIPDEARPVGLVLFENRLIAACSDVLLIFELSEDLLGPPN